MLELDILGQEHVHGLNEQLVMYRHRGRGRQIALSCAECECLCCVY